MQVRYTPRDAGDPAAVAATLPAGAEERGDAWHFAIEDDGVEPLLARITASGHGVTSLSISRPALHDAFVHIVRQVDASFDADAAEDAIAEATAGPPSSKACPRSGDAPSSTPSGPPPSAPFRPP